MGLRIVGNPKVENNIRRATEEAQNSLEKLSSGIVFTRDNPAPGDRALSDTMTYRLRELSAQKRTANDAVSLVETADSALNEVANITNRLRELAIQAGSPTLSDKERKFIFVEYETLRDEINRIATTTQFNGTNLLSDSSSESERKESIQFRIGSAKGLEGEEDSGLVSLEGFKEIVATAENLGIQSLKTLITGDGISIDDVESVFGTGIASIGESFFDAIDKISGYRSSFGAIGSRMAKAMEALDVASENLQASRSRIRDVDYATEISNLTKANILVQAGTSLLTQANLPAQIVLSLVKTLT
ncbi:MAG: flagellin [Silvanigrellaceae bacterium]